MKNKNNSHKIPASFKMPADYFDQFEDEVMIKLITDTFPNKAGFAIPESYFETATDTVAQTLFEKASAQAGFTIPTGYFEDTRFEENVLKKANSTVPQGKVITLKRFFLEKFAPIAVAASLALLVFFNYNQVDNNLNNIATTDIEQWIEHDLISLNDSEILEVFADVELTNEQFFNDDVILDYLDDTNIESLLFDE